MEKSSRTLEQLHRDVMVRLAAATGNLRMLAIGAPFADELIQLAETDVQAALNAARAAEALRAQIADRLTGTSSRGGRS